MKLKELFIGWLTESRYSKSLELRCQELRQDYTERIAEKDELIRGLRAELASVRGENHQFMQLLIPRLTIPAPAPRLEPDFEPILDWQSQLQRMVQDEGNIEE